MIFYHHHRRRLGGSGNGSERENWMASGKNSVTEVASCARCGGMRNDMGRIFDVIKHIDNSQLTHSENSNLNSSREKFYIRWVFQLQTSEWFSGVDESTFLFRFFFFIFLYEFTALLVRDDLTIITIISSSNSLFIRMRKNFFPFRDSPGGAGEAVNDSIEEFSVRIFQSLRFELIEKSVKDAYERIIDVVETK